MAGSPTRQWAQCLSSPRAYVYICMIFTAFETEGSLTEFTQAPFGTSPPGFPNTPQGRGGLVPVMACR